MFTERFHLHSSFSFFFLFLSLFPGLHACRRHHTDTCTMFYTRLPVCLPFCIVLCLRWMHCAMVLHSACDRADCCRTWTGPHSLQFSVSLFAFFLRVHLSLDAFSFWFCWTFSLHKSSFGFHAHGLSGSRRYLIRCYHLSFFLDDSPCLLVHCTWNFAIVHHHSLRSLDRHFAHIFCLIRLDFTFMTSSFLPHVPHAHITFAFGHTFTHERRSHQDAFLLGAFVQTTRVPFCSSPPFAHTMPAFTTPARCYRFAFAAYTGRRYSFYQFTTSLRYTRLLPFLLLCTNWFHHTGPPYHTDEHTTSATYCTLNSSGSHTIAPISTDWFWLPFWFWIWTVHDFSHGRSPSLHHCCWTRSPLLPLPRHLLFSRTSDVPVLDHVLVLRTLTFAISHP